MMKKILFFLVCSTLFLSPTYAKECQVYKVSDGDTIKVLCQGGKLTVRLYGVDTPEKSQPYGHQATRFTSDLVLHKTVDIRVVDTDRYGRAVAVVTVAGESLNELLVKSGSAWVYDRYCRQSFCYDFKDYQGASRRQGLGLWADENPLAPWEYRRAKRQGRSNSSLGTVAHSGEYHGNVKSKVFHGSGCQYYDCRNCQESFSSKDQALDAYYRPHRSCVN